MISLKIIVFFPEVIHVMLSTLVFFVNCLSGQLKPFNSRDQGRRINFRWHILKYICGENSLPCGTGNHIGIIDTRLISLYDEHHICDLGGKLDSSTVRESIQAPHCK